MSSALVVLGALILTFLVMAVVLTVRRAGEDEDEEPRDWPLDEELDTVRAVRESYDGLPYRGGKGWSEQ